MKKSIMLLSFLLGAFAVLASEIVPPDMRIPEIIQEARKMDKSKELWGVDYEQIAKSDKTMTKDYVLKLLSSIDPDKIKLADHKHLDTVITMLEPAKLIFTFEARGSKSSMGPPTNYFLIKIEENANHSGATRESAADPLAADGKSAVKSEASRFAGLDLKAGMDRAKVEEQVSKLLGKPMTYSPYGNNLKGGTVQYRDGDWVLEVTYKPGAPAPTILTPDGKLQGYPPVDETVIEHKIKGTSK